MISYDTVLNVVFGSEHSLIASYAMVSIIFHESVGSRLHCEEALPLYNSFVQNVYVVWTNFSFLLYLAFIFFVQPLNLHRIVESPKRQKITTLEYSKELCFIIFQE